MDDKLFSKTIINLMKGVIKREDDREIWDFIICNEERIEDYISILNLKFVFDEDGGYAYLIQNDSEASDDIPNLVRRYPLNYYCSLILVLLRKKMLQEENPMEQTVIEKESLYTEVLNFLEYKTDEVKQKSKIDAAINKILDMGFLRQLKGYEEKYEILRIIESFIGTDFLNEVDRILKGYKEYYLEKTVEEEK